MCVYKSLDVYIYVVEKFVLKCHYNTFEELDKYTTGNCNKILVNIFITLYSLQGVRTERVWGKE